MTWLFTAQVGGIALAICLGSYVYARGLARAFDRRFGPGGEAVAPRTRPVDKP